MVLNDFSDDALVGPEVVREILGVRSIDTVARYRKAGRLRGIQLSPGTVRYQVRDIRAFIDSATDADIPPAVEA